MAFKYLKWVFFALSALVFVLIIFQPSGHSAAPSVTGETAFVEADGEQTRATPALPRYSGHPGLATPQPSATQQPAAYTSSYTSGSPTFFELAQVMLGVIMVIAILWWMLRGSGPSRLRE